MKWWNDSAVDGQILNAACRVAGRFILAFWPINKHRNSGEFLTVGRAWLARHDVLVA